MILNTLEMGCARSSLFLTTLVYHSLSLEGPLTQLLKKVLIGKKSCVEEDLLMLCSGIPGAYQDTWRIQVQVYFGTWREADSNSMRVLVCPYHRRMSVFGPNCGNLRLLVVHRRVLEVLFFEGNCRY